ncbi:MAG: ATP-grasp domain-containing protein [Dehalococcoidales bacterium]|nr:ATP-grasp domain-containing protein [Dehalococcoidales bacterium]
MRIGLTYDLKEKVPASQDHPIDALEEYDSRETVDAIAAVLTSLGHSPVYLGGGIDFLTSIVREKVDFVFNISEGLGIYRSREAQVPGVLEMLDIPYTGSDPQCLAVCLDKPLTKQLVAAAGIDTPKWRIITNEKQLMRTSWDDFPFPAFVKPVHEGSSKGVLLASKVDHAKDITKMAGNLLEYYRQPVIVEEFMAGDELTVGMVGNVPTRIVGIMRILPKTNKADFVYSLEVKRDWEKLVEYECPAKFENSVTEKIRNASARIFEVLGCRDFARIDFRLSGDGTPNFLEINPLPGLNPNYSDLIIMNRMMGNSYENLISSILNAALERYSHVSKESHRHL